MRETRSLFNPKLFLPALTTLLIGSLTLLLSCAPKESLYRKNSIIMDTLVTITVVSDSRDRAEKAIEEAFRAIRKLEELLNFWSPDSEIAAIYKNAGIKPVKVSPDTLDIIDKAIFISEKTKGAFDPTIGPLMRLWDFKKKIRPDKLAIKKTLPLVNYSEMEIDRENSTAFLRKKGMSFDTGGIAKGYAADRAVNALKKTGIKAGLVAIAGDIRAFGLKPGGKGSVSPWRIGIRNPRAKDKDNDIMATIKLRDEAISTSGDYERFFIQNGVRYHHLLNPETGYPVSGCRSVSVIAKNSVLADGFATGVFIMGVKDGIKLLEELGLEGIIVDRNGNLHMTDKIKERVDWKK